MAVRWDLKRGTNVYHQVSDQRLKLWIKNGKIKTGEVVIRRNNLPGWKKPEELEELKPFFERYKKEQLLKGERRKSERRTGPEKKQIKNILLIDDEKELCSLLGASLSSYGFEIEFAHTKKEALNLLNGRRPDLVLLDLKLPDGNGMTLLPVIRRMTPAPAVIITTAFSNEKMKIEAEKMGVRGIIEKPYEEKDVVRLINRRLLPNMRAEQGNRKVQKEA